MPKKLSKKQKAQNRFIKAAQRANVAEHELVLERDKVTRLLRDLADHAVAVRDKNVTIAEKLLEIQRLTARVGEAQQEVQRLVRVIDQFTSISIADLAAAPDKLRRT